MARASAIEAAATAAAAQKASAGARLTAALLAHSVRLNAASRLWVGLSGGADSTALLLAVRAAFPEREVRASHINHGVQAQSRQWAEQCMALCQRLQVPIDVVELQPPVEGRYSGGFEAWARRGRYQHWRRLLANGDVLLLGHHAADQRETVVLKLLQGRLPVPMPVSRGLEFTGEVTAEEAEKEAEKVVEGSAGDAHPRNPARLLRPWIELSGELMRAYLTSAGESWIEDPSNTSYALLRNRVRHQLLPVLADTAFAGQSTGGWAEAFDRCGNLTRRMVQRFEALVPSAAGMGAGEIMRLPSSVLDCPAAVHAWLSTGLAPSAGKPLSRAQIDDAFEGLGRQRTADSGRANRPGLPLGEGLSLWLAGHDLVLWREPNGAPLDILLTTRGQQRVALDHGTLTVFGAPGSSLVVRPGAPGERLRGRPLRERLRAAGVPRWARASYPIVCTPASTSGAAPLGEPLCIPRNQAPPESARASARATASMPAAESPDSEQASAVEAYFEAGVL